MANLISLDDYKLAKGLTKHDNDDRLQFFINTASSLIQTYIGRDFLDSGQTYTETFSLDYDTPVLYLDKYPVSEIVSITAIDPYGYDSTVHFPVPTISYYADLQQGKLLRTDGRMWSQGPAAVIVTYKAGYSTSGVIPQEIKQAAIDLVSYYFHEEYKPSMQTRGATLTNSVGGTRGQDYTTQFPPHIQRVLDLYK